MQQKNSLQPAYPCTPLQDNYGRLVVPVAGVYKLEYFTLEIFKIHLQENKNIDVKVLMEVSIQDANQMLEILENETKKENNEKTNTLDLI